MAHWYYYDENGERTGPIRDSALLRLVQKGTITPETILENSQGDIGLAGETKGLIFPETFSLPSRLETTPCVVQSATRSAPSSVSVTKNNPQTPQCVTVPPLEKKTIRPETAIVFTGVLLVLLFAAGIGWLGVSKSQEINRISRKSIKEKLEKHPLEILNVSIDWTDVTTVSASGNFTVKGKATEAFYQPLTYLAATNELGFTDLHEDQFTRAKNDFHVMPVSYQDEVRGGMPQDLSLLRFHKLLASEGEEITVSGTLKLSRDDHLKWQTEVLVDPIFQGGFTLESRSRIAHKLDDPQTERTLGEIIQARKDFVDRVDDVWERWERQKREEEKRKIAEKEAKDRERERERLETLERERERLATLEQERQVLKSLPPASELEDGTLSLDVEVRKSGFSRYDFGYNLKDFVQYGSTILRDRQSAAKRNREHTDQFDDDGIKKADEDIVKANADIKRELVEIAKKTYYKDYSYSISDSKNHGGGNSSFKMGINTGMEHKKIGKVSIMEDVINTETSSSSGLQLSLNGSTASIRELVNHKDKCRVRVWFENLHDVNSRAFTYAAADVKKIVLYRVDEEP